MDPLTALSLASGVVQFVTFASDLVSGAIEIGASVSGQTNEAARVEATYTILQDLSTSLEASSKRDGRLQMIEEGKTDFVKHIFAINDLSRSCASDCQTLLKIVDKLKVSGGKSNRPWRDFVAAFKTYCKKNEMAGLEGRLHKTQVTLTIHLCSLMTVWHASSERQLQQLRSESMELNAQLSGKLEGITRALSELRTRITLASSAPKSNVFNPRDIADIEDQMTRLSLCKASANKENAILRSLSFDSRPVRHSSISEASQLTFDWALRQGKARDSTLASTYLLKWLREGEGFFWVTGKPGSGKSTFMKYIADNPKTLAALTHWSRPKRPIVASYYFWSAGTALQKSQQGLLQTLLYDIFRQLPDLIETVCTERWLKTVEQISHDPWTLSELQSVFHRIADLGELQTKLCLFIDGLDEFHGDHVDFCQSLRRLGQSQHVKICVSSRPWNVFQDYFGRDREDSRLHIHELTRNDIRTYTLQRLQSHHRWPELDGEMSKGTWFIDEITTRASGVFLWVLLVTRELRNGLSERDSFSTMQERLNSIPLDLEAFFKHILESVERVYHKRMATTLRLSCTATEPAPIAIYYFQDEESVDEDYAVKVPLQALAVDTAASRNELTTIRLSAWCRGLLEVNQHSRRVEFLHRSVMDYLRTEEMSEFLTEKSPRGFDPRISLIRSYTAYIKTTRFPEFVDRTNFNQHTESGLMRAIHQVLAQAEDLSGENEDISHPLLDELDHCIPRMQMSGQVNLNVWGNPSNPVVLFFREPLVAAGLVGYLDYILPANPDYFNDFERPVLSYVINSLSFASISTFQIRRGVRMVQCLLENGCNPNAVYIDPTDSTYRRRTPWVDFITMCSRTENHQRFEKSVDSRQHIMKELPSLMLKHKANPVPWLQLVKTPEQLLDTDLRNNAIPHKRPGPSEDPDHTDKLFKHSGF